MFLPFPIILCRTCLQVEKVPTSARKSNSTNRTATAMDSEPQKLENSDSVFVWDEKSQLYFHASSGFYHDPNAGWYYSSRDSRYYKFEDGSYVLLDSNKDDCGETHLCKETTPENPKQIYGNNNEDCPFFLESEFEAYQQTGTLADEAANDPMNSTSSPTYENPPPPPSEWLEDMLIDLYLSGHNNTAVSAADIATVPLVTDDGYNTKLAADAYSNTYEVEEGEWIPDPMDENGIVDKTTVDEGIAYSNTYEVEEGEWIPVPEDENGIADRNTIDEGILLDEEKWRAQYGQVIESGKDIVSEFPIVNLWDWEMVRGSKKDGKDKVARLIGRLVKQSANPHPSIPSGGKLRSAPICKVHLDLVRVKTGQVYKLRNPSARYLASLSTYDSANPTKDWDFPQLSSNRKITHLSRSSKSIASSSDEIPIEKDLLMLPSQLSASKQIKCQYRDRAAERRTLHGGYGKGPGQKNLEVSYDDTPSSPVADCPQEAASEALEMTFGAGSYARKLLENMGWKEGEGLGSSTKGMLQPIQPVGNIGSAGLGWPRRN